MVVAAAAELPLVPRLRRRVLRAVQQADCLVEVHLEEVLDFKRRRSVSRMIEGDDGPFRGSAFFSFAFRSVHI